ncbi:MAG: autotransporter-associated beta strand repeat-containing protein [Kiritimatiellia bacterium]
MTISGPIGESGGARNLALNAYSNSITLNGASSNTHAGITTVDGGIVYFGKTGGAYAVSGAVNFGAGNTNQPNLRMQQSGQFAPGVVLNFTNAASNWTRFDLLGTSQTLAGLSGSTGSGVVQNGGLGVGSATDATLTINGSGTTSFNGLIRNYDTVNSGGVLHLVKTGAGTQVMTGGGISYTGSTTISGGILSTDSLAANGSNSGIGAGTALTLDGGTLRYTGGNNGSDGGAKFNRTITVGAAGGTLDLTSGFAFFGGSFTGSGPLTLLSSSGALKQWLLTSSSSSYSGPVTIGGAGAGTGFAQLRSNAANLLGTGTVTLSAGGVLTADNGSTTPSTFANPLVLSGGRLGTQAPNMTFSGPVTLTASTNSLIGHYGNGSGAVNLSGVISGSGSWSTVVDDGVNNVTFSGTSANTFTGGSTVNRGTLVLSKSADTAAVGHLSISPGNASNNTLVYATASNQFAGGSVLTFGGTFNYVARMELNGTTQTLAGLVDAAGYGIVQNSEFGPVNSGMSTLLLNGSGSYAFASNSFAGLRNGSNGSTRADQERLENADPVRWRHLRSPTTVNQGALVRLEHLRVRLVVGCQCHHGSPERPAATTPMRSTA